MSLRSWIDRSEVAMRLILPRVRFASSLALAMLAVVLSVSTVRAQAPNIVVVNLDDADFRMLTGRVRDNHFPEISRLARLGIEFMNCHVTTPLCGPSRAAFYRGQYNHHAGVRVQSTSTTYGSGFRGGYREFVRQGHLQDELGVWMKRAGYHTVHVGKYIHEGYDGTVPPGWDDFTYSAGALYYRYVQIAKVSKDETKRMKLPVDHYRTNDEGDFVLERINRHYRSARSAKPLFLYWAPLAPHAEAKNSKHGMIDESLSNWWQNMRLPARDSFNEQDVSDKPGWMNSMPSITRANVTKIEAHYRERMIAVRSVDNYLAKVRRELNRHRQLENTVFIITSDNGYLLGEHRQLGKQVAFEEACHVPLIVSGAGVKRNRQANHLLAHIDITATILDLAGARIPADMDGQSFKELLEEPDIIDPKQWREAVLIENWQQGNRAGRDVSLAFSSVRLYDSVYVEWATGGREYYDLSSDPSQLENSYDSLSKKRKEVLAELLRLNRSPSVRPIATIYEPLKHGDAVPAPLVFRGLAEDDQGISSVRVRIRDLETKLFWDGTKWSKSRRRTRAELANENGVMTEWELATSIPATEGKFQVSVFAYDNEGNRSEKQLVRRFHFDLTPPNTNLRIIRKPKNANQNVILQAEASDNDELRRGTILIRNVETGYFFNGKMFQAERETISFRFNQRDRARLSYRLPSGNYVARLFAHDIAGNSDASPAQVRFRVP